MVGTLDHECLLMRIGIGMRAIIGWGAREQQPGKPPKTWSMLMNIRQLALLRLVIETGGYARAAAAAGIFQPAVSQAMHKLEQASGNVFFARNGRARVATAAAHALARASLPVQDAMTTCWPEARAAKARGAAPGSCASAWHWQPDCFMGLCCSRR
jgi:molybdenum-dependent DNA-binding transcriptional regulator ModE